MLVTDAETGAVATPELLPSEVVLRVQSANYAAEDVLVLRLVNPHGATMAQWQPGSHLEIVLPSGLIRHYSLCGPVGRHDYYEVAIHRVADGRGGSRELHDTGLVGRLLTVRGPRSRFQLVDGAPSYLLVAGGIGVTPLVSMAEALADRGASFSFVYGARSAASFAFLDRLREHAGDRLQLVDEKQAGRPDLRRLLEQAPGGTAVYCCGPEPMIAAAEALVAGQNGRVSIHVERFEPSGDVEAIRDGDTAFELVLSRSGKTVKVGSDQTALDAVLEEIPSHPFSCREGECGSCEVAVLAGRVDHRDEVLSDDERAANSAMMLCVSRALSPQLVIDL